MFARTLAVLIFVAGVQAAAGGTLRVVDEAGRPIPKFQVMLFLANGGNNVFETGRNGERKVYDDESAVTGVIVRADGYASALISVGVALLILYAVAAILCSALSIRSSTSLMSSPPRDAAGSSTTAAGLGQDLGTDAMDRAAERRYETSAGVAQPRDQAVDPRPRHRALARP
jgi:hypothetical protein